MIGYFKVKGFDGSDIQNAKTRISVESEMDSNIQGVLYLPPYLRPNQCDIKLNSSVYGVLDDVTGLGVALFGLDDADFKYFFDADINIKQNLTVTKDIKSVSGDVIADRISLKSHTHRIAELSSPDGDSLAGSVTTYQAQNPWPTTSFTTWSTMQPTEPIIMSVDDE